MLATVKLWWWQNAYSLYYSYIYIISIIKNEIKVLFWKRQNISISNTIFCWAETSRKYIWPTRIADNTSVIYVAYVTVFKSLQVLLSSCQRHPSWSPEDKQWYNHTSFSPSLIIWELVDNLKGQTVTKHS